MRLSSSLSPTANAEESAPLIMLLGLEYSKCRGGLGGLILYTCESF